MNTRQFRTAAALLVAVVPLGCSDEAEHGHKTRRIARVEVSESQFKPADLEATIDDLVGSLSGVDAATFEVSVIIKNFGGYWESVQVGANRAIGELELCGQVEAPLGETGSDDNVSLQVKMVEDRVEHGWDGLGLAPLTVDLATSIDAAVDAGIPVVTFDSDLPDSRRHLYVGTDNTAAGRVAGETLVALIPEPSGTVFILGTDERSWLDGYHRTMGAKSVLEAHGYAVVVDRIGWVEPDIEADFVELPDAIRSADPPAVGMLGMFANAFRAAQIAEAAGFEPGELKIVAFDFEPDTLAYMQNGYIQATHAQRQYYMGYLVPYALYSIQVLGIEKTTSILGNHMANSAQFDTGVDVVQSDQVDQYNAFLDSLGIGG